MTDDVHHGHAALAEHALDGVLAQSGPGGQAHRPGIIPARVGRVIRPRAPWHAGAGGTVWWALAACGPRETPSLTTWSFRGASLPGAPGDVVVLDLEQQRPDEVLANVEPVVVDGAGRPVALVERTYLGFSYGWAPAAGFAPGDYVLTGAAAFPVDGVDAAFTVAPFGAGGVDAAELVGRSWALTAARSAPQDLGPLAFAQGTAVVVVESAAGTELGFALLYRGPGGDCVALRDVGDWDAERGELRWELRGETLFLPTADGDVPLPAEDLWLDLQWLAEDPDRAAGQASALVDTRALSEVLEPGSGPEGTCELAGSLGFPCVPCEDGVRACLGVQVVQGSLSGDGPLDASGLPRCGLDRVDVTLPAFTLSCDLPIEGVLDPVACGCAASGRSAAAPLTLAALLVRRRRRPEPRAITPDGVDRRRPAFGASEGARFASRAQPAQQVPAQQ